MGMWFVRTWSLLRMEGLAMTGHCTEMREGGVIIYTTETVDRLRFSGWWTSAQRIAEQHRRTVPAKIRSMAGVPSWVGTWDAGRE